jgi:hypothetical protein
MGLIRMSLMSCQVRFFSSQCRANILKQNFLTQTAPYCKQLYIDVTNSNHGKITWKILKPIIQGKIIYGPVNDDVEEIMKHSNFTFVEFERLHGFFRAIEKTVQSLHDNKDFREKFDSLLNLAKTPIVQAILGGAVDIETIENVLTNIINDKKILEVLHTIGNIFECYSVDRFVRVKSEKELEDVAFELGKKKLFYAAVFFTNDPSSNEISYKLRMDVDNSPVTIENRNKFWFPGPEGSFNLEMRYHRGFIQIQSAIDNGIIRYKKKQLIASSTPLEAAEDLDFSDDDFTGHEDDQSEEDDFGGLKLDDNGDFGDDNRTTTTAAPSTTPDYSQILKALQGKINISDENVNKYSDDSDYWSFEDDDFDTNETTTDAEGLTETTEPSKSRKKRQLDSLLGMFGLGGAKKPVDKNILKHEIDEMKIYTKQFPYPKHTRDPFKKAM